MIPHIVRIQWVGLGNPCMDRYPLQVYPTGDPLIGHDTSCKLISSMRLCSYKYQSLTNVRWVVVRGDMTECSDWHPDWKSVMRCKMNPRIENRTTLLDELVKKHKNCSRGWENGCACLICIKMLIYLSTIRILYSIQGRPPVAGLRGSPVGWAYSGYQIHGWPRTLGIAWIHHWTNTQPTVH
jgi:hypothetical protein